MSTAMAVTTHDAAAAPHRAAAALHPLLDLIRAAPFGSSRALWTDAVIRPLQARRLEGAWVGLALFNFFIFTRAGYLASSSFLLAFGLSVQTD
jgi:hypothetical protein